MATGITGKTWGTVDHGFEEKRPMTTVLIIVCIVFCIGVILAIVSHLGYGIARDRGWRFHVHRHHAASGRRGDEHFST